MQFVSSFNIFYNKIKQFRVCQLIVEFVNDFQTNLLHREILVFVTNLQKSNQIVSVQLAYELSYVEVLQIKLSEFFRYLFWLKNLVQCFLIKILQSNYFLCTRVAVFRLLVNRSAFAVVLLPRENKTLQLFPQISNLLLFVINQLQITLREKQLVKITILLLMFSLNKICYQFRSLKFQLGILLLFRDLINFDHSFLLNNFQLIKILKKLRGSNENHFVCTAKTSYEFLRQHNFFNKQILVYIESFQM